MALGTGTEAHAVSFLFFHCQKHLEITATLTLKKRQCTAVGAECHKLVMWCDLHLQLVDLPGSYIPFMFNLIVIAGTVVVSKCLTPVHKETCSFYTCFC